MRTLPETGTSELLRWIFRRRKRYRVTGRSMLPQLEPGDHVLAAPVVGGVENFQVGDIIVMPHPSRGGLKVIKRISKIRTAGFVDLSGDNPRESTDFLDIPVENIIGIVTSKFA